MPSAKGKKTKKWTWDDARAQYEIHEFMAKNGIWWPENSKKKDMVNILEAKGYGAQAVMANGKMSKKSTLPRPSQPDDNIEVDEDDEDEDEDEDEEDEDEDEDENEDEDEEGGEDTSEYETPFTDAEREFFADGEARKLFSIVANNKKYERDLKVELSKFKVRFAVKEVIVAKMVLFSDVMLEIHEINTACGVINRVLADKDLLDRWDFGEADRGAGADPKKIRARYLKLKRIMQGFVTKFAGLDDTFDCEERRKFRARFYCKGKLSANRIEIPDPDNDGEPIRGDIVGHSPFKVGELGVCLPSNNPENPKLSRGVWINGEKFPEEYKRYVMEGANVALVVANLEDFVDCDPGEFELNCVFSKPWGKGEHKHAFGIPHFITDRPFMLYSRALLVKVWTATATDQILDGHRIDAGQIIKSGATRVSARAWRG